jgi:hypothetical protein
MIPGISASITLLRVIVKFPQLVSLLILGENGTGKRVIASEIHRYPSAKGSVKFNCSRSFDWSQTGIKPQATGSRRGLANPYSRMR